MNIVPVPEIPLATDVPAENLFKVYDICKQLQALCEQEGGVGIAAVQAGIPWKLFLVKFADSTFGYFVNCEYKPIGEDKILHIEGCLSLRTSKGKLRTFEVERYRNIEVSGHQLVQEENDLVLKPLADYFVDGFYAAVFQHEIQHQQNILISDIGKEVEITRL